MDKPLMPFEEALDLIGGIEYVAGSAKVEERPLEDVRGCVLADTAYAELPSPPFTNSAMDGFAYRHTGASGLCRLPVIDTLYASDHPQCAGQGHAHRIMTGAELPSCADSVVPVEECREPQGGYVEFELPSRRGLNVRIKGEDLDSGQKLYEKGRVLDSTSLLVLASQGFARINVKTPPRIGIVSTGSEIVDPGQPLKPGMIYNSSKTFLKTEVNRLGLDLTLCRSVPDDRELTRTLADEAPAEIVVSTGGISMGQKDYIPGVLEETGYRILFHGVAMRPGQPNLLAVRDDGCCWLGLPGNAISTMVGFRFFFLPLVRRYYGLPVREEGRVAELTHDPPRLKGKTRFYRGTMTEDSQGEAKVTLERFQASYAVSPTIRSNCFLRLDSEGSRLGRVYSYTGQI